jgi:hypothetical protein
MRIFLGSSKESLDDLLQVARWLGAAKHEGLMWDNPDLFIAGVPLLTALMQLSKNVDAAILLFAEDDKLWYREDAMAQPRDNVLVEYGLFLGALGQGKAIVCRKGRPKTPTDLGGIIYIDLDEPNDARIRLNAWVRALEAIRAESLCAEENTKRSIESLSETSFTITNRTKEMLTIYWLDYQGRRQEYFKLMPDETRKQPTYRTHPWVVADPTGRCIRLFYAPGSIIIDHV